MLKNIPAKFINALTLQRRRKDKKLCRGATSTILRLRAQNLLDCRKLRWQRPLVSGTVISTNCSLIIVEKTQYPYLLKHIV